MSDPFVTTKPSIPFSFAVRCWFVGLLENGHVSLIKFDVVEPLRGIKSHGFKDEDSFKVVQRASESTRVVIVNVNVNRSLSLASLFLQSLHLV